MKKLILATLMLGMASIASAEDKAFNTNYDMLLGVGVEGIALSNACITDTELRSKTPVKVCANLVAIEHRGHGEMSAYTDWVCAKWEMQSLVRSRSFVRSSCAQYKPTSEADPLTCIRYEQKPDFLPEVIDVMTTLNPLSDKKIKYIYSKFTFPRC